MTTEPLLSACAAHLAADARLTPGTAVVVAVSGGADSVALLRALATLAPERRLRLVVAHLHHGLRGPDADADAAFVAALAGALGAPARLGHADVAAEAAAGRWSFEDAARRARRRFLAEVLAEQGGGVIALGHTRDDQAETVLLNLLRGSGPRGLGAMPAFGPGALTRPLLAVTRAEARDWLTRLGQPWREDSTNADPTYTRNRIRNELLPWLTESFNPALVDTLARQAELFADLDAFLTAAAGTWLDRPGHARLAGRDNRALALPVTELAAEPVALRAAVWRVAAERLGGGVRDWGWVHHEALDAVLAAAEDGETHLPDGWRVLRQGAWLYLAPATAWPPGEPPPEAAAPPRELPLLTGAELSWGPGNLRVTILAGGPATGGALRPPDGRCSALFDREALGLDGVVRLWLRSARPGDRLAPFGATGHRPLTHVLAEAGIPAARRSQVPVLSLETDEIIWIPGVARSNRGPIGPGTHQGLLVEWFGPPPHLAPGE